MAFDFYKHVFFPLELSNFQVQETPQEHTHSETLTGRFPVTQVLNALSLITDTGRCKPFMNLFK